MIIPQQLQDEKFIILEPKSKTPLRGISWTKSEEQHDAKWTEQYCTNSGANYGVLYSKDTMLCVIDIDNAEAFNDLNIFITTYTVRTGRPENAGKHVYLRITNIDEEHDWFGKKLILYKEGYKDPVGDIRMPGFTGYNVGPYCIHPSGNQYTPEDETTKIKDIKVEVIELLLEHFGLKTDETIKKPDIIKPDKGDAGLNEYGVDVLDFLRPDKAEQKPDGSLIGAHPIHGSQTGKNLHVFAGASNWYCFRHNVGGGIMKAIAVANEIIDCEDAGRELTKDEVKKCYQILNKMKPEVAKKKRDQWKQKKHEEKLALIKKADEQGEADAQKWQAHSQDIQNIDILVIKPVFNKKSGEVVDTTYDIDYPRFANKGKDLFQPILFNKTLYIIDKETNLYVEDSGCVKEWIAGIIADWQLVGCIPETRNIKKDINEIYERILYSNVDNGNVSPFNRYPGIPLKNGVLRYDRGEEAFIHEELKNDMKFTRRLNVSCNPKADTTKIAAIVRSWVGSDDDYQRLLEIPAIALLQTLPDTSMYKRAYIIQGEKDGGKSSYLKLLELIFGETNISHIPLIQLGDRWTNSVLLGKYLNTADDMTACELRDESYIKKLTGGKQHTIEEKGKAMYNADLTAVHIFTCNHTPSVTETVDRDDAFWSRWCVLKFPYSFPRSSNWEKENFTVENIDAFFSLIIDKCEEILIHGLDELDMEDMMNRWKTETNPISQYLDKCIKVVDNDKDYVLKDDVYEYFMKYFDTLKDEEKGMIPAGELAIKKRITQTIIRQYGGEHTSSDRIRDGSNRVRGYRGLKWDNSNQEMQPFMPPKSTTQTNL